MFSKEFQKYFWIESYAQLSFNNLLFIGSKGKVYWGNYTRDRP